VTLFLFASAAPAHHVMRGRAAAELDGSRSRLIVPQEENVALLSPAFVRRRVISMAATLSLSATSLALAQGKGSSNHPQAAATDAAEQQFLFDNDLAISKMTRSILANPTGDVDRDFVAMMIPHHQGTIDMARAELKYGHKEELRRLAQDIVTKQAQEISIMREAIGDASERDIASSQAARTDPDSFGSALQHEGRFSPPARPDR
jgi:Domain of unknown function (DUF305)